MPESNRFGYPLTEDSPIVRAAKEISGLCRDQSTMYLSAPDPDEGPLDSGVTTHSKPTICGICGDKGYCSKFTGETLFSCTECRRESWNTERTNMSLTGAFHINFRLTGDDAYKELFYGIAGELDKDWPIRADRKSIDTVKRCCNCKGIVYNRPTLYPDKIKRLALQCGLKIKIKDWLHHSKCKGQLEEVKI